MRSNYLSIFLIIITIVLAACSPINAMDISDTQAHDQQILTKPSISSGDSNDKSTASPDPVSLTVLAAASLTESFTELGKTFEAHYPFVKITFNFAGSQTLGDQLTQGAPADVFASANMKYMTEVANARIVNPEASQIFATNRLVVIFPIDNPAGLNELTDLAKPGVKIILAGESVPVGSYSINFLDKASTKEMFGSSFKDDVLKNVVSYEINVKSVLAKVSLGEADAGIVYVSDISDNVASEIRKIDIPDELNTIATYPIAPVTNSKNLEIAQLFVNYVLSPEGQKILEGYNFISPGN